MKLEQLHYLKEAIRYRSLSIAARENFISQPSFSAAITGLEKELGVKLLNRSNRGCTPTDICMEIMDRADTIFAMVEEIELLASNSSYCETINIAVVLSICEEILPQVLLEMEADKVFCKVAVASLEGEAIYPRVASGSSVLGIVAYIPKLLTADLKYTPLFEDEYVLYIGQHSPFWEQGSVSLEQMLSQPYIALGDDFATPNSDWAKDILAFSMPKVESQVSNLNTLKKMIINGPYVSLLPRFMVADDIYVKHNLMKPVRIDDIYLAAQFGYIENTRYKLTKNYTVFLDYFRKILTRLGYTVYKTV
ncbi:transcriptional regulator, LysR family [Desulfitobacterium hafniense DCB-2]|uniref:Transcriptional regulator, LysR family n=1 Tax=Desulfitobacterium hafniense (strain DSM 10664 / DCB-2) TaxID=272564 RepID=B8FRG0_DESHD|nr:LysR family transcriptional regulator [Desulfitobacterium hafniense]ACL20075.1 transcriptional regulator, LysR family [Desulfitobacterium hafniense DCB-2]